MSLSDSVGRLGESYVATALHMSVKGKYLFKVTPLGEKYEVFDFMVNLLDDARLPFGPFFMLQVKTKSSEALEASLNVSFTWEEVVASGERKVPAYLVGVEAIGRTQSGFFLAIDRRRTTGIYSVSRKFNLNDEEVLEQLYREVAEFFSMVDNEFESIFI